MKSSKDFKISVYITSYNQKEYLIEAIDSVLDQTLKPYEIIIVDDCSKDGSREVISEYAERHKDLIKAFYNKENMGYFKTSNIALGHVKGDLVCYLDGDDRFLPRKLELEAETYLRSPDDVIVYSNFYYIDSRGKHLGLRYKTEDLHTKSGDVFSKQFLQGIEMRNWLIDYGNFRKFGFYDESFLIWSDWDMIIRLTKRFKVAYCSQPLTEYRIHPRGTRGAPSSAHLAAIWSIYRKNRYLLKGELLKDRVIIHLELFRTMFFYIVSSACESIGMKKAKSVIFAANHFFKKQVPFLWTN